MNKKIVLAAAAAAFSTAAYAQDTQNSKSSLALYGLLDSAITYKNNVSGGAEWALRSGITQSNFGLRGVEDIGGGLKAVFGLESGLNISNGKVSDLDRSLFNREGYIGLSSNAGTISVGRQYSSTQDYLSPISAIGRWGGMHFAHIKNKDFLFKNTSISIDNTVKFTSRDYNGLKFGGTYSLSNNNKPSKSYAYSAGISYQCQDLHLAASYFKSDNNVGETINSKHESYGLGATYKAGPAKIGALWTESFLRKPAKDHLGYRRFNAYEVNARYNLNQNLSISTAYSYMKSGREKSAEEYSRWNQIGVQTDYIFSKRTNLYAQVIYQVSLDKTKNNAHIYEDSDSLYFKKSIDANQVVATVGLRHSF